MTPADRSTLVARLIHAARCDECPSKQTVQADESSVFGLRVDVEHEPDCPVRIAYESGDRFTYRRLHGDRARHEISAAYQWLRQNGHAA